MSRWPQTWKRLQFFIRRKQLDHELGDEIRAHLELEIERNISAGMTPKEGCHAARRAFGNVASVQEAIREVWGFPVLEDFFRDLRYGFRMLARTPVFTVAAVLSLALAIGANSTVFSVLNTVVLRPFPYESADRVVRVTEVRVDDANRWRNPTLGSFLEWSKNSASFQSMGLANQWESTVTISVRKQPEPGKVQLVSQSLFSHLGVEPHLGRGFVQGDLSYNMSDAVIVSYKFWRNRLGADPNVLGEQLVAEGTAGTIIGVMPQGFWVFPWNRDTDIWRAFNTSHNTLTPSTRWFAVLGRLRPGVTVEQAQMELETTFQHLQSQSLEAEEGWRVRVETIQDVLLTEWREPFSLLFGFAALVLLIGCANVANMLLARSRQREKEIAVRMSLGAGRRRLARQLMTEALFLGSLAGLLGLLLTNWGIQLLVTLAPEGWSLRSWEISIDSRVLLFTAGLSLLAGVLFGMVPALRVTRLDLHESLKEGGRRSTGGSHPRTRSLLVVAEVKMAVVLLVCAGLMVNSFFRVRNAEPGFEPSNLLRSWIHLQGSNYLEKVGGDLKRVSARADIFFEELLRRTEALPGVESAAVEGSWRCGLEVVGTSMNWKKPPLTVFHAVSAGYFKTMGISLRRGRAFSERDTAGSQWVAVINEALARQYFPGETEVIGKLLSVNFGGGHVPLVEEERPREIVGVIGDIRHWGLGWEPQPAVYVPNRQHIWEFPGGTPQILTARTLLVRTATSPMSLAPLVENTIIDIDREQAPTSITTMEQELSESIESWRFWMRVFGFFACVAVTLAMVGIYGVMSCAVSERTHEIGVRMALGAQRRNVLYSVLRQGLTLTLLGVILGMVMALGLTRFISSYLYEVTPTDPLTFVSIILLVFAFATAACLIPACWAIRVDPQVALRCE